MAAHQEGLFISDSLKIWKEQAEPSLIDFRLAEELAYGTERRLLSLDEAARQLASRDKLKLKLKEKMVLRLALYQHLYLSKIPLYAIADEMVGLARRYCHPSFAGFLNAVLRKLETCTPKISKDDLSTYYSYPPLFIEELTHEYGAEKALEILELFNAPSKTMVRDRTAKECRILEADQVEEVAMNPRYYIQNATPVDLIGLLVKGASSPKKVLDLCAAPGGKLLAVHDLFPDAELWANDVSEQRLQTLRANLEKYQVAATLSCCSGEEFPEDQKFDLIILDVPCSNSGVLHKRPEARWRLTPEALTALEELQLSLLKKAGRLLAPGGQIWYLTCSILRRENESLVERVCTDSGLQIRSQFYKQLPNSVGWDGGFACALSLA